MHYAGFILAAYAAVAIVVVILILWITIDYRSQKRQLRELEESGMVRRSGRSPSEI